MIIFITAVLLIASIQSFCKLSLLPRRWEFLAAAFLVPLPFLFESGIAQTSMQTLNRDLSSAGTLENWCALVVIQELFTLTIGFSLLAERDEDSPERKRIRLFKRPAFFGKLKLLVFLPSVLLPAGALYLQMFLFNAFPGVSFRALTWGLALLLPLVLIASAETVRFLRKDFDERILAVLHTEYFLVFPAIFLPVAATASLMPTEETFPFDSLITLGAGAAMVALSAAVHSFLRKRKKFSVPRSL